MITESGPEMEALAAWLQQLAADPDCALVHSAIPMHGGTLFEHMRFLNLLKVRRAEIPAVSSGADARSIPRMCSMLAQGGELDGTRVVSSESIDLFRTKILSGLRALVPPRLPDWLPSSEMRYALGYEGDFGESPKPWRVGATRESFAQLGQPARSGSPIPPYMSGSDSCGAMTRCGRCRLTRSSPSMPAWSLPQGSCRRIGIRPSSVRRHVHVRISALDGSDRRLVPIAVAGAGKADHRALLGVEAGHRLNQIGGGAE